MITWPGTDLPVGGTIDPDADPVSFAPVIIQIVESIEDAGKIIQKDPKMVTPFSNNEEREFEAIVQQTIWVTMAAITGESYGKDDFSDNTFEQYANVTKTPVSEISEKDEEKINEGVDDFWDVFMATGVEAKVIKAELPRCKSNGITFDISVTTTFGGLETSVYKESVTSKIDEISIPEKYFKSGGVFTVSVSDIKANCWCECEGEDIKECEFYPNPDKKGDFTKPDMTKPGKVRISRINTDNTEELDKEVFEAVDEFKVELTIADEEKSFELSFNISGYCITEDCKRDKITDKVEIAFNKKIKKE